MNQERGASISVRLAPKTAKGHGGQTAHDLRKSPELEYVDYSRSPRNSILIPPAPGHELREICEQRRNKREAKRSMKSNARVAFEGIITFSKLAQPIIEALPLNEQDSIFKSVAEKIAEHLNTTLHGLVVHRDESAIHAHFTLAGYDLLGNPLTQTVKRQQCIQIQDIAGEVVKHLGISRGKSKIERIKDGEPLNAYINRSVQQLHNDLPKEIEELEKKIEELTEKERKNAELLEKTLQKLAEASESNEKLQKRAETYQKRLEKAQKELEQAQSELDRLQGIIKEQKRTIEENWKTIEDQSKEIERLKHLVEPQKPEPVEIKQITGWRETGWGPFKGQEPVLKPIKIITTKQHEQALLATRKAAEEEAKRKAEAEVQDELDHRHYRIQELEQQLEQNDQYQNMILEAIQRASEQQWLSSAKQEEWGYDCKWTPEDEPPEIIRYNATLLDYNTKLVAIGDGTPIQQAAAIYTAAREKGWESTVFWGMNEAQVEWLVKAAEKDGYEIDFEEEWAKGYAEEIRQKLLQKQQDLGWDLGM